MEQDRNAQPGSSFPVAATPTGAFPTGSFPTGAFPTGAFPTGSFQIQAQQQEEGAEVNLRDYLRIVTKHVWVIIAFFIVVNVAVAIHTFRQPRIFKATARVNIRREVPELSQLQSLWNFYSTQQEYMETQYKIIASKKISRKTIQTYRQKKGISNATITEDEVTAFQSGIIVSPVKDTFLVDVSYEGIDPQLITDYVNTVVDVYIDLHNLDKTAKSLEAEQAIEKEMPRIVEKLREAEAELRNFQQENNLLSFDESKARLNQKLDALEIEIFKLEKEYIDYEAQKKRIDRVESTGAYQELGFVQESRLVTDLKLQISRLNEEYVSANQRWLPGQTDLETLRKKIEEKKSELEREIKLLIAEIVGKFEELREKLAKRLEAKAEIADMLNSLERKKFEWDRLQDEVQQRKSIYESAASKMKEISYATGVSLSEINVVDSADLPKAPIKPKPLLNMTMAAVIGLLGGIGLAFFFEYLDDTVKGPEDVERYLKTPLLGIIPSFGRGDESKRDLQAMHEPKSTISEMFRSVRTGILFSSPDHEPSTLLVWSAGAGEGKTLVSINLSIAMAQAGSKVVIVDGDLRRPRVHKAFGIDAEDGLSSFLSGQKDLSQLLLKSPVENLSILPAGPTPPNPSELLGAKRMKNLVRVLLERFDKVVIDSPPAMAVTDAAVLASITDGMIQVVSASNVSRKLLARSIEQMIKLGGKNLGAVLNKVKSKKGGYGYYSGYYYGSYYGPVK